MDFIRYFKLDLDEKEEQAVLNVLRSGWLTSGKLTKEFEEDFKNYVKSSYSVALNSATAGLHLGLKALGIKENDKILLSPYSFVASSEVIHYLKAIPYFVDIKKDSYHLDYKLLEDIIKNNKIKAIMTISIGGVYIDIDKIIEIAKLYNVKIIEDAAHSFPANIDNKFDGTHGDLGVYSFYANKTMTTGEGGMLVTNNKEIADKVKVLRMHGISRDVFDRFMSKEIYSWDYDVVENGFKYNITDIASAIGIEQLKKARVKLQERREIAKKYIRAFQDLSYITLPPSYKSALDNREDHSWHLYSLILNLEKLKIDRDEFANTLINKYNIGVSVHFKPIHMFSYYKNKYAFKDTDFKEAFNMYKRSISLPIYPLLKNEEINYIINSVIELGNKFYKK